ncbi:pitrilysin family protein [Synechococcus sp. CBW1004]|uniref:M16 family metallopeptidase n=1 Tax=Synechococcus sp. CBW1004 TaxID=1353136 RepID=UPI0018CD76DA|nr:pitrilysin family protein [Synechococcus sp. CBW1004]QPN63574.1 insulinase family protein [Synechococcus sp. CBW1004]
MSLPTLPAPPASLSLSGGLPVTLLHRPGPAILSARLVIRGGSGMDPSGCRGAHQLLAGLMTRGCGELDAEALADLVEGAGAGLRCEAGEDSLVLALKCAAEDSTTLLPLLLAMVRRPRLEPDQLDLERQLNLQSLQRQREDPFQLAHDQLRHQLYGDGPYGHDPLGVEEELAQIGKAELRPLVADLGRQGAVLVLCGQLPEDPRALLEPALAPQGWCTAPPSASSAAALAATTSPAGTLAAIEQDTEQLVLLLGCATLPLGHPDTTALRLIQAHLGVGMSSRLFVTMREERGLAYDVGVHLPARCGAAPFVLHLSTSAERAEEACRCLLDEWQRLRQQPLSEAEWALALAKHRGQDAMARQTCSQIAERQALLLSHGLPADHFEHALVQAAALTPADLQAAAQCWLGRPSLSLVGPSEAIAGAEAAWRAHPLGGQN